MNVDATGDATPAPSGDPGPDVPQVERPLDAEKLLRLANLAGQVLEEARQLDPADENTAGTLAALHGRVTDQLRAALPQSLADELEAMDLDEAFSDGATPQEVRIAYAGLIGWLGGLLQGLQTAMQMAHVQHMQGARQQGAIPPAGPATGQYL